ncbi:MAG: amidohydrolase [Candidatus Sumerlaeia bacterium]|nr:amidohydrolase [Candidatus Sumerlaeia bacterium]
MSTPSVAAQAHALQDWIVERRRTLHRQPELSFREEKTAAFVERELGALGYENLRTRLAGHFSLCAELPGRDTGRIVALRADMDALPIEEETESPFRSQVSGVSHMCGHDAHTAMLLGVARLLKQRQSDLPCTVRLFFQGAEETSPGGALDFVETGLLDGVTSIYGLHVFPWGDTGTLHLIEGRAMAGVETFTLIVRGKGGHAAYPHMGHDAVLASAHIVTALQQIVSRTVDPLEPAVVSVTRLHGGEAHNVLPETVEIGGTIRSFRPDIAEHYGGLVRRIANGVAEGFGCTVEYVSFGGYPPLVNDSAACERMRAAGRADLFPGGVQDAPPTMGAEDFAHYAARVPGAFGMIGVAAPDDTERFGLHHPRFRVDEEALWRGTALLATLALEGQ